MGLLDSVWALVGTAVLSAAIGAAVCHWWCGRVIAALQRRLQYVERARDAELERAKQARVQIGQLTQLLADLQKRVTSLRALEPQRPQADAIRTSPAVKLDDQGPPLPRHGFADTQPL